MSDRRCSSATAANSLLLAVHSLTSKSSKCTSTAQACRIWWVSRGALQDCALVVVPCAFSDLVITFRCRRKGDLVLLSWSIVDFL